MAQAKAKIIDLAAERRRRMRGKKPDPYEAWLEMFFWFWKWEI